MGALLVFAGGGLGAVLRYGVNRLAFHLLGPGFPWSTIVVNVLGSLLMGLLIGALAAVPGGTSHHLRQFLATGLLKSLAKIGTAAMLWVGGGILLHGLEALGAEGIPHAAHDAAHAVAGAFGPLGPVVEWIANAIAAAIAGAIVGGIIVLIVRQFTKHPEKLVVDN